jgi:hypothetical protein
LAGNLRPISPGGAGGKNFWQFLGHTWVIIGRNSAACVVNIVWVNIFSARKQILRFRLILVAKISSNRIVENRPAAKNFFGKFRTS